MDEVDENGLVTCTEPVRVKASKDWISDVWHETIGDPATFQEDFCNVERHAQALAEANLPDPMPLFAALGLEVTPVVARQVQDAALAMWLRFPNGTHHMIPTLLGIIRFGIAAGLIKLNEPVRRSNDELEVPKVLRACYFELDLPSDVRLDFNHAIEKWWLWEQQEFLKIVTREDMRDLVEHLVEHRHATRLNIPLEETRKLVDLPRLSETTASAIQGALFGVFNFYPRVMDLHLMAITLMLFCRLHPNLPESAGLSLPENPQWPNALSLAEIPRG